jgi:hypothetical protein
MPYGFESSISEISVKIGYGVLSSKPMGEPASLSYFIEYAGYIFTSSSKNYLRLS